MKNALAGLVIVGTLLVGFGLGYWVRAAGQAPYRYEKSGSLLIKVDTRTGDGWVLEGTMWKPVRVPSAEEILANAQWRVRKAEANLAWAMTKEKEAYSKYPSDVPRRIQERMEVAQELEAAQQSLRKLGGQLP